MNIVIEELLGRNIIEINNPLTKAEIQDKVILVTGAAGSIGSDIVKQLLKYFPKKIILIDQSESGLYDLSFYIQKLVTQNTFVQIIVGNITDELRMNSIFRDTQPQLVFHAAAYKHVPMMESNPYEAVKVNIFGTRIMSNLSIKYGVSKFVLISTDKAVNPSSIMGMTKKVAELSVQSLNVRKDNTTKFVITRFGNVLESNGSVIPLFKKQIKAGGLITVTHPEITRYFITIEEASELVLEAVTMGEGGEIYFFDMGEPIKIAEIAKKMIAPSGSNIKIQYIGLRSGEKLHEELLNHDENMLCTHHPKIKYVKRLIPNLLVIEEKLYELNKLLYENNDSELIAKLRSMVSDYKPNNFIAERLDKNQVNNYVTLEN
jgi:FlaA1/EpsC-like NDP-sugar epimerase